jgi:UDP-galactopyranose mutase
MEVIMTILATTVNPTGAISWTGGTALALDALDVSSGKNKQIVVETAVFPLRRTIDFSYKAPVVNALSPSGYTQRRCSVIVRMPILTASGAYTTCTANVNVNTDVEMTDADILELRNLISNVIYTGLLDNFYNIGSLE